MLIHIVIIILLIITIITMLMLMIMIILIHHHHYPNHVCVHLSQILSEGSSKLFQRLDRLLQMDRAALSSRMSSLSSTMMSSLTSAQPSAQTADQLRSWLSSQVKGADLSALNSSSSSLEDALFSSLQTLWFANADAPSSSSSSGNKTTAAAQWRSRVLLCINRYCIFIMTKNVIYLFSLHFTSLHFVISRYFFLFLLLDLAVHRLSDCFAQVVCRLRQRRVLTGHEANGRRC